MEAENGAQGLELAERLQPNLIVLDFSMPVMNGLEAAPLFKKKFPETPIIMFTMFVNDSFAKVAVAAGVTEVISKDKASHLFRESGRSWNLAANAGDCCIRQEF
jgi:DNA-binding NarL/FixJ family response regulator